MKLNYEAPVTTVQEVKADGLICTSPVVLSAILYESPAVEIDWGRNSYGSATTDTWE